MRARLTGRGLALLIVGLAGSAGAAFIGELDLLWLMLLLAALPLLALIYLLVARPRIDHERTLEPPMMPIGETARAVLRVLNNSPAQSSALRFSDAAEAPVGGGASFVIARGFGRWHQAVGYSMEATSRGRFTVGPLIAQATDPFGLATRTVTSSGENSVLRVTPHVWRLNGLPGGAGLGAAGDATPQRIGQAGTDDVLVREHRHGDDMRRVHWKMSAKRDDLMVRLEEHPWDPSSTLIVDTRRSAHPDHSPRGSLEWAVSAVASVGQTLLNGRFRLSIVAPSGVVFESGHSVGPVAQQRMLEALTDLAPSEQSGLSSAVTDPEALTTSASIIAATGLLGAADAAALSAAGSRARSLVALVPDAAAWGAPSKDHVDACRLLRSRGWRVETFSPGENVPSVWERVVR